MEDKRKIFEEQGYTVLRNVGWNDLIHSIYSDILLSIEKCAIELKCSTEDYLSSVSRWVHPSPIITDSVLLFVDNWVKKIAGDFMGKPVTLSKINIISKSAYSTLAIPCHQDIAYSKENPYQFSIWLALQNVSLADGPLEFLPRSHLEKIEPAIDFWEPNFIDKMALSSKWQKNFRSVPVRAGDAILFDSRIWHRSADNKSNQNRFALVTRWSQIGYPSPSEIPEKIPAKFGMWTCGELTRSLLQRGLYCYDQENVVGSLTTLIQRWQRKLKDSKGLPFMVDLSKAQKALGNLLVLQKASEIHNGGDAQGIVYPELWRHFLAPLVKWLDQFEKNSLELNHERAI